jgi:hypothetical protein
MVWCLGWDWKKYIFLVRESKSVCLVFGGVSVGMYVLGSGVTKEARGFYVGTFSRPQNGGEVLEHSREGGGSWPENQR